jgi:hypothetical protein
MPSLTGSGRSGFNLPVTAVVLGVWLVLLGVLVREHYFPDPSAVSDSVSIAAAEADDWFMIRIRALMRDSGGPDWRSGDDWLLDELNISLNIRAR